MVVTRFHIPDLIALCGPTFELQVNGRCRQISEALLSWTSSAGFLTKAEMDSLPGLQLSLLASLCYPSCDWTQLLLISKYLTLLFHWSNKFEPMSASAFECVGVQLSRETTCDWQRRFETNLEAFRRARIDQDSSRPLGDIKDYHRLSRSYSGISTLFDLVEYATGLRIPPKVHRSQEIQLLKEHAHDIIVFAKDIIAHNYQQSRGCHCNLVSAIIEERQCTLQSAIDVAEVMFKDAVVKFLAAEHEIPSRSVEIDEEVGRYVQGLRECIIGFIHWLYETDRYFGDKKGDVREFGWVFLLPKQTS